MPKVTIWIRNEDYDKWDAIKDKPEWLHEHINTPTSEFGTMTFKPNTMPKKVLRVTVGGKSVPFTHKSDGSVWVDTKELPAEEPKLTPPEDSVEIWACYKCDKSIEPGQKWKHFNSETDIFSIKRRIHTDCV